MTEKFPTLILNNAFNILGLPSSSKIQECTARAQEISLLAKIGSIPQYETDIGNVKDFRKPDEIRTALEKVSSVKNRLQEAFFWFEDFGSESQFNWFS
ncbi:MAG: hypothetical protein KDK76_06800, partial [Chlamydiia bacterium]|nr:hypothetical protein [Chlamydiia bacterium]